jgi:hypothetical protein
MSDLSKVTTDKQKAIHEMLKRFREDHNDQEAKDVLKEAGIGFYEEVDGEMVKLI